jgi:putative SOS response-associated peptidase YedK
MRAEKKVSVYAKNRTGEVVLQAMHWGLVPATYNGYLSDWNASTSHARLETVAGLPAFEGAWRRKRRVIFPMECFYEKAIIGQDLVGRKGKAEKVAIKRADEKPMGVAGIYDYAQLLDGPLLSAAMLTREPGRRMSAIHDREPVVLEPGDWQVWLDGSDAIDLTTPWANDAFDVVPAAVMTPHRRGA